MRETKRIVDQLNRGFYGDAWHGPAVMEVLKGVTAARAASRPISRAHSIWEIAHHIGAWKEVVRRRITGELANFAEIENFPTIVNPTSAEWKRTVAVLTDRHEALVKVVGALSDADLAMKPRRGASTYYVQIHGVVQHDLYHAGQIVILKKAG